MPGIFQDAGELEISTSRFAFNGVVETGAGPKDANGGAIAHRGRRIDVDATVFAGNTAEGSGSAVDIFSRNPGANNATSIQNSLFYENTGNLGGRLNNGAALSIGRSTLNLRNNTFFANRSENGASSLFHSMDLDVLALSNNAFGASGDGSPSCRTAGDPDTTFAGAFNLFTDASCGWLGSAGTQEGSLQLVVVGVHSIAESPDVIPAFSSPLVDAGSESTSDTDYSVCANSDLRESPRPRDNDADNLERCTIGAFENAIEEILFRDGFEPF